MVEIMKDVAFITLMGCFSALLIMLTTVVIAGVISGIRDK